MRYAIAICFGLAAMWFVLNLLVTIAATDFHPSEEDADEIEREKRG
jgi:hypothetical protein